MLTIRFDGLKFENILTQNLSSENEWIKWYSLKLFDCNRSMYISEWFYVAACSPVYKTTHTLNDIEQKCVLSQVIFNERDLANFAQEKFNHFSFKNWDEFYEKMQDEFIYAD